MIRCSPIEAQTPVRPVMRCGAFCPGIVGRVVPGCLTLPDCQPITGAYRCCAESLRKRHHVEIGRIDPSSRLSNTARPSNTVIFLTGRVRL